MKVGEIIVKPPSDALGSWVALVRIPPAWGSQSTTEDDDGYPAISGAGSDAALAIKALWQAIGRAYLGAEASKALEPDVVTRTDVWDAVCAYAAATLADQRGEALNPDAAKAVDDLCNKLGLK